MTALIAVEHHPAGLTTGFPCHFQRFHGEPAVRRERHGPAYWFSCEQVENNGEVRPALTRPDIGHITAPHLIWLGHGELPFKVSLFRILCKCLFSEVTVQAVTELDNKAAHCHSPVLQRHRPFLGRRLDCQPHHFFHRVVCREHFTLFDRMADHAV